jgi:Lhr-like helicase
MRLGNYTAFIESALLRVRRKHYFAPKVVLVYTSRLERSMFRYREPRTYRVVQHDVGHLLETAALVAGAYRRRFYRDYACADTEVEQMLGVDYLSEPVVAFGAMA